MYECIYVDLLMVCLLYVLKGDFVFCVLLLL